MNKKEILTNMNMRFLNSLCMIESLGIPKFVRSHRILKYLFSKMTLILSEMESFLDFILATLDDVNIFS